MPIALRTVKDVLDDVYVRWRGEVPSEASADERKALIRCLESRWRDAWKRYEWFFAIKKTSGVAVAAGEVTIPSDCESVMLMTDPSTTLPIPYTQRGTTTLTLLSPSTAPTTVDLEYRTNLPVLDTNETEEIPTELYEYCVYATLADAWSLDRQHSKHQYWLGHAWDRLKLALTVIENQRGLKKRSRVRNYRNGR